MKPKTAFSAPTWRTHLIILFLLLLIAPIHMIPLFPHFSSHILGDVMDTAEYPLDEWWTAHALLDLKTNPFYNSLSFFPLGQNLVQHTYTFLDGLFFSLLRPVLPLIPFHNLIIWFSFFANASAAYILFFYCLRIPWLAFLGALAFGHSPTLISYYKTASLLEIYNFILFVFLSYSFFQKQQLWRAVPAGLVWGLTLYNYPYYFVFGGLWLAILSGYQLFPWKILPNLSVEKKIPPWGSGLLWIGCLGVLLSPVLIPRRVWEGLLRRGLVNWGILGFLALILLLVWTVLKIRALKITIKKEKGIPQANGSFELKFFPPQWSPPSGRILLLWAGFCGISLTVAALVGFPFFWSYLREEATRLAVGSLASDFSRYSVDYVSFFAPFNDRSGGLYARIASNWVSGRPIVGTPAFLGYGFIVILCLGIGQFFRRPDLRLWLFGFVLFSLLCLGPSLKIHGLMIESLPLPAYWLRHIPILESTRTLSRYLAPAMLFLCLLTCLILKPYYLRRGPRGKKILLISLFFLIGFEYGLLPYPLPMQFSPYQVPSVYKIIAQKAEARTGVLLDLPLLTHSGTRSEGKGVTRQLYYQTVHRQRMLGGVSSKLDESVFVFFQNQPAVKRLWSLQPVALEELAALIYAYDINWIVMDKHYYMPESLIAYRSLFRSASFLKIFFEDDRHIGISVDLESSELKKKAIDYWGRPESLSGLIYPPWSKSLTASPPPCEMIIPLKLWGQLEVVFPQKTFQAFYGMRLSTPEIKGQAFSVSFPPMGSKELIVKPKDLVRLNASPPASIKWTIEPGKPKKKLEQSVPFSFSLLSLGQCSGYLLSPSQFLIDNRLLQIDRSGITALRLSNGGAIREQKFFGTAPSNWSVLAFWLKNFASEEYLALIIHQDGSLGINSEVSDILRSFGANRPLKEGDSQHSYALLGRKGMAPGKAWEAHVTNGPSFISAPAQAVQVELRLDTP